jgi:hypothetical protein
MQILDVNPEDENEEDGANVDLDSQRKGKCVVLKTSTRQVSVENTNIYQHIFEGVSVVFVFLLRFLTRISQVTADNLPTCGWPRGSRHLEAW